MSTLLERLRQARDGFTARERAIATELEGNYPHAGLESATALAERVGASTATVVRFIAKLGYSGYQELQRELRAEVEARLTTPLQRLNQSSDPAPVQIAGQDIVQRSFEAAMHGLTRSFSGFDRYTLDRIASTLIETRGRIFILGEKKGRAIALYLYAHLNLCLPRVALLSTDAGFEGDQVLDVGEEDVILAVDVRRYVRRGLKAAELAVSQGAKLIVLADSTASPLFGATPLRICAATTAAGAFDSYVSLMFAADVVSNLVVAAAPQATRERLQKGEAVWRKLGLFEVDADPST